MTRTKTTNGNGNSSEDWGEIVYRGVESEDLDYKAAQDWTDLPRAGKAKFARHVMALANTRGGYIVVGVGEDSKGNPTDFTGLTEKQLRSFDPSTVGQTVNRYADPSIEFDIVRPEIDGNHYAIFVVRRFQSLPHVCSDACGTELQRGVFYMRTPDARSRAAYRASELHDLVQRALRNQRQSLGRMIRGVLYEGRQFAEPDAELEFQKVLTQSQNRCRDALGPRMSKTIPMLEVIAYPSEFEEERIQLTDLRKAADKVILPPLADFPFLADDEGQVYFTNQALLGVRSQDGHETPAHFWQAFRNGLFHHVSALPTTKDSLEVPYPALLRRVGAALTVLGQLYSELGLDEELLTITFRLSNCEGHVLVQTNTESPEELRCYIPEIVVRKRRTVADLDSAPAQHAVKVVLEMCERFNLSADDHIALRQRLSTFLENR